eukprot:10930359-Alexandrium_andersonii.AAC.1
MRSAQTAPQPSVSASARASGEFGTWRSASCGCKSACALATSPSRNGPEKRTRRTSSRKRPTPT